MTGRTASWRARARSARLPGRARQRIRASQIWLQRARLDVRDRFSDDYDPLLPPRRYGLPSQIRAVGDRIVAKALIAIGDLQPNEVVLDIGCGPGRVAAPLTRYLTEGSYEGFDVMPRSIRWAQRRITPRHPNFRFQVADIHNLMYNPKGSQTAEEFRFPYPDGYFDVSLATSVYTHLRPYETANYLRETARVMKPGGRILNTFFLLNEESERLLEGGPRRPELAGGGVLKLDYATEDPRGWRFRAANSAVPEHLLAVHEDDVRRMYEDAGLEIGRILPGHWCGRPREADEFGQDLVIARKR